MIERMKAISEGSRENVKAPSRHLSCKSSTTLQLFKELAALLQTIDCRKVWGQTTKGNRARLHSLFGMKFTQVPSQYSKQIKEVQATIKL
jgi:hypothetical protein